jgi:hypothetical protein
MLGRIVEAGMILDRASRHCRAEWQRQEVLGWSAGEGQLRARREAEAGVEGGIAQHDAAGGADRFQADQAGVDKSLADAGALPSRDDGDRAEAVPVLGSAVDLHGGEGDVTDRCTVFVYPFTSPALTVQHEELAWRYEGGIPRPVLILWAYDAQGAR